MADQQVGQQVGKEAAEDPAKDPFGHAADRAAGQATKRAAKEPGRQPAGEAPLPWTDERVELLRKLWLDGLSASRIAAELAGGVSRNAVIGKVHRLGLSGRVKPQAVAAVAARPKPKPTAEAIHDALRAVTMPMRGNVALALQDQPMARPALVPHIRRSYEDNVIAMAENVTIMELRESMCRWPVGDPSSAEFRYCGGKAPIGEGPYCKHHSRMAYQPTQDRRQRKIA